VRKYLPRPHQLVLIVGVLAALGTLASYTAPELTGWHNDATVSREVFGGIPAPVVVAFYLTIATMLISLPPFTG